MADRRKVHEFDEHAEAKNYAALSDEERRAIESLERLAKRWPKTLTLVSMGGSLSVIRSNDPRFGESSSTARAEAVIASINGIPNDGGDW